METRQTRQFADWLDNLRDRRAERRIRIRIARIESGNMGDVRSLGGGVSEARIDYGPGYRLYFARRGQALIVLLCGGEKGSQQQDIDLAREIAAEIGSGRNQQRI